jgi:hypothetical protein
MKTVFWAELASGTARRSCWVDRKVKAGDRVTLRDSEEPERLWDVLSVGAPKLTSDINHGWHVGGL